MSNASPQSHIESEAMSKVLVLIAPKIVFNSYVVELIPLFHK